MKFAAQLSIPAKFGKLTGIAEIVSMNSKPQKKFCL